MPYGEGRHLAPLVEMVRTACGITDEDEPEVADRARPPHARPARHPGTVAAGSRRAGRPAAPPARHRARVGGRRAGRRPGRSAAAATASSTRRRRLLRALAAEGPLLVVIDDLQWASEELLEAIGEVAKRLRGPILLVLVGREPADDRRICRRRASCTSAPLDEATAHRLLRAYLGGGELADPLRSAMLEPGPGQPVLPGRTAAPARRPRPAAARRRLVGGVRSAAGRRAAGGGAVRARRPHRRARPGGEVGAARSVGARAALRRRSAAASSTSAAPTRCRPRSTS